MPHTHTNTIDSDIAVFSQVPPPPYPGTMSQGNAAIDAGDIDLTPMPQSLNRPRLPEEKRNPYLQNLADRTVPEDTTIVKFQTIVRDNREIVVGRVKLLTGAGTGAHAFILRRYDTDAISLTTMYKVAFPGADEEEEKREMDWVKSSFDTRFTNGGRDFDAVRLAGVWVSRHLAVHLAPAYGLADVINPLARAVPDPNVTYRRSVRSQQAHDEMRGSSQPAPSLTTTSATPQAKRQRLQESVPTPTSSNAQAPTTATSGDRHLTLEATTTITAPAQAIGRTQMEEEIAQARQMVLDLKRELRLRAAVGEDLEDQGVPVPESSRGRKRRADDDEGVAISGGAGKVERVVRKNRRVENAGVLGDTGRRVAWGAVMFGLGLGAAAYVPRR